MYLRGNVGLTTGKVQPLSSFHVCRERWNVSKTDEKIICYENLTTSATTNDNEWYNECQRVIEQVTTNDPR